MKGATMLATLQRLGVVPSFSRPSVSDDNPYIESLFRTLKYCPEYPSSGFASVEQARQWVARFVGWYNDSHQHSGIGFVTPAARHAGDDVAILEIRRKTYARARARPPSVGRRTRERGSDQQPSPSTRRITPKLNDSHPEISCDNYLDFRRNPDREPWLRSVP